MLQSITAAKQSANLICVSDSPLTTGARSLHSFYRSLDHYRTHSLPLLIKPAIRANPCKVFLFSFTSATIRSALTPGQPQGCISH